MFFADGETTRTFAPPCVKTLADYNMHGEKAVLHGQQIIIDRYIIRFIIYFESTELPLHS